MDRRKINNELNNFLILQWNCRSLRARRNDFSFMLAKNKCQCALLSETWLLPNSLISIPNYLITAKIDLMDIVGLLSSLISLLIANTLFLTITLGTC